MTLPYILQCPLRHGLCRDTSPKGGGKLAIGVYAETRDSSQVFRARRPSSLMGKVALPRISLFS